MTRLAPLTAVLILSLGVSTAAGGQSEPAINSREKDEDPVRRLSRARVLGDAREFVAALDLLAAGDPDLCACVVGHVLADDPWPHAGFDDNESYRRYLTPHLAELGITPTPDCAFIWSDHVPLDLPDTLSDPIQIAEMDLVDKRQLLMQLALYAPYERSLFDRLIHLSGTDPQPAAQEFALMAAARLLGRAPVDVGEEAGALLALLLERAAQLSTRENAATIAGVVVGNVTSVNLVLLTQYLGGDPAEQRWALDVWRQTNFRHLDDNRGVRVVEVLLESNLGTDFGWTEAGVLAHVEPLTGLVYPRITILLGSSLETDRIRGVQWAAATHIEPDLMLPWILQLYSMDTPGVRAMCLWGIAEITGSTEHYVDVIPLLPTFLEDLHHPDDGVRAQASDLLRQLVARHCRVSGPSEGLGTIVSTVVSDLDSDDPQRKARAADFLSRVRSDCLPPEIRRELGR